MMTIDTIRDVLGRIISINKNLTEDSLRNLLVASGWEPNDIEEGIKVFRDYTGNISLQKITQTREVDLGQVLNSAQQENKVLVENEADNKEKNVLQEDKNLTNEEKQTQAIPSFSLSQTNEESSSADILNSSSNSKPWVLIVLDIILFIIALGILLYILFR